MTTGDLIALTDMCLSIWILFDATKIGVGFKARWGWIFACLLLPFVGILLYLFYRGKYKTNVRMESGASAQPEVISDHASKANEVGVAKFITQPEAEVKVLPADSKKKESAVVGHHFPEHKISFKDVSKAVQGKSESELTKAFVGNTLATVILLQSGDSELAADLAISISKRKESNLFDPMPRVYYWALVMDNLAQIGGEDFGRIMKNWRNFTSDRIVKTYKQLALGLKFDQNVMVDVVRGVINIMNEDKDPRVHKMRVGAFGWNRLTEHDQVSVLDETESYLEEGDAESDILKKVRLLRNYI
jgi:hypothetical protein